jgi:hypothetical protein
MKTRSKTGVAKKSPAPKSKAPAKKPKVIKKAEKSPQKSPKTSKKLQKSKAIKKQPPKPTKKPSLKKKTQKITKKPVKKQEKTKKLRKSVKKVEKKKKSKKEVKTKMGYTKDELKKYKEIVKEYFEDKSIADLKEMLRINNQSRTGDKNTLCQRIADGIIKGQIPRCSKCGGGFLKYDYNKGMIVNRHFPYFVF